MSNSPDGGVTSISILNKYSLASTPTHDGAQRIDEEEVRKYGLGDID